VFLHMTRGVMSVFTAKCVKDEEINILVLNFSYVDLTHPTAKVYRKT
jgi:hypothetical protein